MSKYVPSTDYINPIIIDGIYQSAKAASTAIFAKFLIAASGIAIYIGSIAATWYASKLAWDYYYQINYTKDDLIELDKSNLDTDLPNNRISFMIFTLSSLFTTASVFGRYKAIYLLENSKAATAHILNHWTESCDLSLVEGLISDFVKDSATIITKQPNILDSLICITGLGVKYIPEDIIRTTISTPIYNCAKAASKIILSKCLIVASTAVIPVGIIVTTLCASYLAWNYHKSCYTDYNANTSEENPLYYYDCSTFPDLL